MRGGSLAFAKFSCAILAILSFLMISPYFFLLSKSTEQYQGIGLALKMKSYLYSLVFLANFLF